MIVGYGVNLNGGSTIDKNAFTKNFDGQGFTLKNININIDKLKEDGYIGVGIFGVINNATFKNLNIDYMGGGIKIKGKSGSLSAGGFAGRIFTRTPATTYSNISLKNIGDISVSNSNSYAHAGGFAGEAYATFTNISLNNIGNISASGGDDTAYAGGLAGEVSNGFTNISLNNIGNISASGNWTHAGGLAGSNFGVFSNFINISLNNIGNISASGGDGWNFAGGFIAESEARETYSNISLNNIGNISASGDGWNFAGGFIGYTYDGMATYSNISLNNIGNISASGGGNKQVHAGGFVGRDKYATYSNISLNNIGDISGVGSSGGYWVHAGGFAGNADGDFSNISLNNIGDISGVGSSGGFIGYITSGKFKNIYMFFDKDSKISTTSNRIGKFCGNLRFQDSGSITFDNIHIYHHENDFTDIMSNINTNKFTTHIYGDDNKDEIYQDFKEKDATIARPILTIMPQPSKPSEDLSNPNLDLIL
ncbi:hypothetical protein I9P32_01295, partial [Campylobacter peloridis]|nr:hypothetical protein [Campylobacter peloridis]